MAYGGAGTLFALAGGVFTPIELAVAAADKQGAARLGKPLFVQISDTHIGFNKDANPDVNGTLTQRDRKSTRLNSSHQIISYAVFCLKKKKVKTSQYERD